jgi:outer membrane protein TolC
MKMQHPPLINRFLTAIFLLLAISAQKSYSMVEGQDSLSLKQIIDLTIRDNPSVSIAEEAINNANVRIGLAKTGHLPEVDLTANYSNIAPVTKLSIPEMGTFQLFPSNNYSASVNYRQVIFDFGRTRQNIDVENEGRIIGEQGLEQTKQKLSMLAVNNYFTLLYLQSAISIKDEQLRALNEHLAHVNKMLETGSATEYLVLSTRVRISNVESQKVDLVAALNAQKAFLISLIGEKQSFDPVVSNDFNSELPALPSDSLLSFAFRNRNEIKLNQEKESLAELRYGMVKLQNKPMLSIMASGGAKNGYVPYLNDLKPNYVVGLGLRVPIFDGNKNKYNILQARSAMTSLTYESESTRRQVANELSDAQSYLVAAEKKVVQYSLQLEQAQKAYSLALISFNTGVITNLDLLDANTAVSESRLLLLKARIDYAASIYKFRAALGERLY